MKILFFSPHTAIWQHAFPEALVAEALAQKGQDVVYITCGEQFADYCIAMNAVGLDYDSSQEKKNKICIRCNRNKSLIRRSFGFAGYDLSGCITEAEELQIGQTLNKVSRADFLDFALDGLPLGRIALYFLLLKEKKSDLEFTDAQWKCYRTELKNVMSAYFACRKILEREKPERVVVYNSLYPVHRVCALLAEQRGIPVYFLHAGMNLAHRLSTIMFGRTSTFAYLRQQRLLWNKFQFRPCTKDMLANVTDHFIELLKGRSVFAYSSPKEGTVKGIRERYRLGRDVQILVATMSSYDERFAAETINAIPTVTGCIFGTQIEWIKDLIRVFGNRPDVALIIRVHPREFPNKRESNKSPHAQKLESVLEKLPENVRVNWPADNLSLYDLAEEAAVFLNAWSSVGKEMSLFGIPVVIFSPDLVLYPETLNYVGETRESYYEEIERALREGWSAERIRQTYRWYALEFTRSVVDISESYRNDERDPPGMIERIAHRARYALDRAYLERRDCKNRARSLKVKERIVNVIENGAASLLDSAAPGDDAHVTVNEETKYLQEEVRRLAQAMYASGMGHTSHSTLYHRLMNFGS